jgi:hypothetical protein
MQIKTAQRRDGVLLYMISQPPERLPPVTKRDLEQAWEAAQQSRYSHATPRCFRFAALDGETVELALNDTDAASWAEAVDRQMDLTTAHGVSVCLRLLALVALLSRAAWLRPWFSRGRAGLELHPALLQAAALAPLNGQGAFDERALEPLLPSSIAGRGL